MTDKIRGYSLISWIRLALWWGAQATRGFTVRSPAAVQILTRRDRWGPSAWFFSGRRATHFSVEPEDGGVFIAVLPEIETN